MVGFQREIHGAFLIGIESKHKKQLQGEKAKEQPSIIRRDASKFTIGKAYFVHRFS